jgi:ABC-type dipeptide/oligopeptide/nickel transport system permease component
MLGCDVLRGALIASVPVTATFNRPGMGQLFVVAALTGLVTVVFQVAYLCYVSTLLD